MCRPDQAAATRKNHFTLEGFTVNTYMAKPADVERTWYVIDAEGMVWAAWRRKSPCFCAASTSPPLRLMLTPAITSSS